MKIHILFLAGLLPLSACGPAPVPHGKAGLWNFTTTLNNVNPAIPPAARVQVAMMGMTVPDTETHDGQICMTQDQVKQGTLPPINPPDSGCTGKVTRNDSKAVAAVMTCSGSMKGTGQLSIAYADDRHYAGTYNFKGTTEGKPLTLSSSFKASWAKADCGPANP